MARETDPRLPPREHRPLGRGGGLHRRRRPRLLHRRQHRGVRHLLRRPAARVPPVHAAVQRHGHRRSCCATSRSCAGSTACASPAARRSAWRATSRVAAGHASFGQAGPVHGSAPDGGSTDFLHLYVGYARAAECLVLCEPWSAYKAQRLGLVNEVVAVHRTAEGRVRARPAGRDRALDRRHRPHRLRRLEDRRGAGGGEALRRLAAPSTWRRSTRRSTHW